MFEPEYLLFDGILNGFGVSCANFLLLHLFLPFVPLFFACPLNWKPKLVVFDAKLQAFISFLHDWEEMMVFTVRLDLESMSIRLLILMLISQSIILFRKKNKIEKKEFRKKPATFEMVKWSLSFFT